MKRIATLILSAITLLTLLTGCVHEDIGIKLNEDGTGSIAATVGIDKDVYNEMIGMGFNIFSDTDDEPTEYEYKGKTYLAMTESTEYKTYDELRQALLDLTYETDELTDLTGIDEEWEIEDDEAIDFVEVDEDDVDETDEEAEPEVDNHIFKEVVIEQQNGLFSKTLVFSAKMNAIPDDPEISLRENSEELADGDLRPDAETSMSSAFLVSISVEMPDEITSASENATVEGNKATFEISDLTVENEFAVESTQNNAQVIVAVVAVLVLILIGLLIFAKFHKDKE